MILLAALSASGLSRALSAQAVSSPNIGTQASNANRIGTVNATGRPGLEVVPEGFSKLNIDPGFLLQVSVLDDADYSGSFRVDEQGNIALPIVGLVHVGGGDVDHARAAIAKKLLESQILKDPQVTVNVAEYVAPEVTVLGEVHAPGRYPLLAPMDLSDLLAMAGGPTAAAGGDVEIRSNQGIPIHVAFSGPENDKRVGQAVLVHPGDTVQVERAGIVYVLGAVTRPGGYVMEEGGTLSVLEAISMANGTTLSAALGKVYLLRKGAAGQVQIAIPLKKMQRGQVSDLELQPADILYVPNSKVKSALMNTQGILSAATSAGIYAAAY